MNCEEKNTFTGWDFVKRFPAFRYLKAPVFNVRQLYERYCDGSESGAFAFVISKFAFYGWDFQSKEWKPIGSGSDDTFPEGSVTGVTVGFLTAGSDVSGLSPLEVLTKILFGTVFNKPSFANFSIDPSAMKEVGDSLASGTVFRWETINPESVKPNGAVIKNETTGETVASNLAGSSYVSDHAIAGINNAGTLGFSLSGTDIKGEAMNKVSAGVVFGMRIHTGNSAGDTIDASQIQTLNGVLKTAFAGEYPFTGGDYKYVCIPDSLGSPSQFIDPVTGFNVPVIQQNGKITVKNLFGIDIEYNVWRSYYKLTNPLTIKIL